MHVHRVQVSFRKKNREIENASSLVFTVLFSRLVMTKALLPALGVPWTDDSVSVVDGPRANL
jgi:hypothetical protein